MVTAKNNKRMENRKRIIELLTVVRYTTNDIEKVADEICLLFGVSNCTDSKTKTCYWCKKRKPTDSTYLIDILNNREIRICDKCNYDLDIV